MIALRSIGLVFGAGVLLGGALFVAGCDEHTVGGEGTGEVVFDVGPLFRTAAGEPCVSVVDTLQLTVTEADGAEQTAFRLLTPDVTEVRIPVEVDPGSVRFEAEVRSNNGSLLYTGATEAGVEAEGFQIEVTLDAVNAVLKACPDLVPLGVFDTEYRGDLRVINRGDRSTTWAATVDPPLCDGEPCFRLDPDGGDVGEGDTVAVAGIASLITLTDAYDVRITSPVGTLDVRFVIEALRPVARPDTVAVLEGGTVEIDVLANDTDPEGDPLTLISVGPATFGTTEQDDDLAYYTADYVPAWGTTSEDGFAYVVDAGGRRAEGQAVVRVDPCMAFETEAAEEVADVPLYTENGVTAFTRLFDVAPGDSRFTLAQVALLPQSNDDLGLYLDNAAIEFDWSQQPVYYVQFDFLDGAALLNMAINDGDRVIVPDLMPPIDLPPGITARLEEGKFDLIADMNTRLVLEADAATPITRLLLGGGGEFGDNDTLLLDDVCFGLAPPDPN